MNPSRDPATLPPEFTQRLERLFPPHIYERVLQSFSSPKTTTFRVNPLKTDASSLQKELESLGFEIEAVDWLPGAFRLLDPDQRRALTESGAFYEGRLYIQNLSSMLAPLILAPRPEEQVLDLAAAPGGKTLMMAGMMENRGWISAVEPVKERFHRLKRNIENAGAEIVHTYMKDGRSVGRACPAMFDRVLLDAPCSSEAKFSTLNPKSYAYWSPRKVKESQRLQKRLILSAWQSLRPGGRLLYSTCSFAPEENEAVVDHLLGKAPDAKLLPIELPIDNQMEGLVGWEKKRFAPELERARRVLPTEEMDGFFLALIEKSL
ncbi:RsmB/NOP family class I SAM-dependent RNA methyltransferase [Nitratifractor salsuginis]|uniref:RNA methylase, NOL1/NOP2/sun family n=1 Tax=Nitratifractor salsuginis (strain DSM 16511 / JCM 12458 / E9I37-1) TaxID=749222 RepID=E6WZS0_NITSE|nr:RsmB/NOP family class I SAM-dependent RNA methyltransferase [Nitratifractor salsuginis]ADV46711.1 RNA methylase, NOL1/NOP2/sun family [Nitratifractor salsuginis DSM 16511]